MKVLLTVPSLNVAEFKGLARISSELYKGLLKKGIEVEVYEVYAKEKNYFNNLTKTPLKQLLTKADIFHSTVPEVGTFTPFFKPKTVTYVHDFIPYLLDIRMRDLVLAYTTFMWGTAIRFSKILLTNSKLTARVIKRIWGRDAIVISPGVDQKFKPLKLKKGKKTLGL